MKNLHDQKESVEFYEARYQDGYMEEWDEAKKNKVRDIIKELELPEYGKALDFGCGNGVFTKILKECLPQWEVLGVEISKIAVANATKKYPDCTFFIAEQGGQYKKQFDFLFSHHVIEHVPDLTETFEVINSYLKNNSSQLHILPCGNAGSLEYSISKLKKNGIEQEKENRFFFEEPGHLRRLNTDRFANFERGIGFRLQKEFYANQYHGSVNWITKSSPRFVKMLTNGNAAISEEAKKDLRALRKKLLPLTYQQFPYSKYWFISSKWKKSPQDYLKLSILFLPAILSKPLYIKLEEASNQEWLQSKHEKNGSEMFLFFKREG